MAMIPKTVGDMKKCLAVYADDVPLMFSDEDEGYLWYLSLDKEAIEYTNDIIIEAVTLSLFERFNPYNKSS
jgi:hypothetical protein